MMTLRGLLMWSLGAGAVVFMGVAGASGYQLLSGQYAQSLAQRAPETSAAGPSGSSPGAATPSPAVAAAEPQPNVPPANSTSAMPAAPRSGAATLPPLPPLRRHIASATEASDHPMHTEKRITRRVATAKLVVHHPVPLPPSPAAATAQQHVPSNRTSGYAAPRQPGAWYPPPPTPPPVYYPYQGYYGYRTGYAYYAGYPRYPYYPAY